MKCEQCGLMAKPVGIVCGCVPTKRFFVGLAMTCGECHGTGDSAYFGSSVRCNVCEGKGFVTNEHRQETPQFSAVSEG